MYRFPWCISWGWKKEAHEGDRNLLINQWITAGSANYDDKLSCFGGGH